MGGSIPIFCLTIDPHDYDTVWAGTQLSAHIYRSDNGPELVARKVQIWLAEQGCETIYISPGSPWENAYVESFIGKFRKECVDRYLFYTLKETRSIVEDWRQEYNHYRPHSSLGYLPPSAFAAQQSHLPDQEEPVRV